LLPMHVKRGDRVLVSKFAGHDIELDGQMYLLIAQRDVLGILRAGVVVG
jgi:Co-chaperonin GroES (HSP10)